MSLRKVGALWRKRKANGEEFFAGTVSVSGPILIFKNKRRKGQRDPDFIVTQPVDQDTPTEVIPFARGSGGLFQGGA